MSTRNSSSCSGRNQRCDHHHSRTSRRMSALALFSPSERSRKMRALSSPENVVACFSPRTSTCSAPSSGSATRSELARSYLNSMEASGNASPNQLKTTKSATATTAAQTARKSQSARPNRSFTRLRATARNRESLPSRQRGEGGRRPGEGPFSSRQLLERSLHPADPLGCFLGRELQGGVEARGALPAGQHHH